MTNKSKSGIRLNIADDNVSIDEDHSGIKQPCFGDVKCGWSEHRPQEAILHDGAVVVTERWYCNRKEIFTVNLEKCPIGLWLKMAVPIGWQNRNK